MTDKPEVLVSDTPRTDVEENSMKVFGNDYTVPVEYARQLERELSAMTARAEAAEEDVRRLDWIINNCATVGGGNGFTVFIPVDSECTRAAIDLAIKESE